MENMENIEYFDNIKKIREYIEKSQFYANNINVNLSQIGIIREISMASILKHHLYEGKHNHDAEDKNGKPIEYLSKKEKYKSYCFDCMFSRPQEEKEKSLKRITRNHKIYCGSFKDVICMKIYEIDVNIIRNFVNENLIKRDKNGTSKNNEHTICIPERIIIKEGELIYDKS